MVCSCGPGEGKPPARRWWAAGDQISYLRAPCRMLLEESVREHAQATARRIHSSMAQVVLVCLNSWPCTSTPKALSKVGRDSRPQCGPAVLRSCSTPQLWVLYYMHVTFTASLASTSSGSTGQTAVASGVRSCPTAAKLHHVASRCTALHLVHNRVKGPAQGTQVDHVLGDGIIP